MTTEEPTGGGELDGLTFAAFRSTGHELVDGAEVRLEFADGRVAGTGGCNSFAARPYRLDGDTLVVDGPLAQTMMACSEELMAQDDWLAELLTGEPTVSREADRLILELDGETVTFAQRQVEPPPTSGPDAGAPELAGTSWELESIVDGDTVSPVTSDGRTPTLAVDGDELQVDTGCNRGRGSVLVGDDRLEIGALATTRMACPGAAADVERAVLAVLDGPVDFELDGATLTITNGDRGLVYRAG